MGRSLRKGGAGEGRGPQGLPLNDERYDKLAGSRCYDKLASIDCQGMRSLQFVNAVKCSKEFGYRPRPACWQSASAQQFDKTDAVLWQLLCSNNASATDNAPSELFLGNNQVTRSGQIVLS